MIMQNDANKIPDIQIRPMARDDYPIGLSIMNKMWPQFNFTENDLHKKDREHGDRLLRFIATIHNEAVAFCNFYLSSMKPECHFSIFYTDHISVRSVVRALIAHILHISHDNGLTLTSRILEGDDVLGSILNEYGFKVLSAESDLVFDISLIDSHMRIRADINAITLHDAKDNADLVRQLYELEIPALSLTRDVSWLSLELFTLSLFSMKNLVSDKSMVLIRDAEVVGYTMLILTDELEYKIRKIRINPSNADESIIIDLIDANVHLLKHNGIDKVWLSINKNESMLINAAVKFGFSLTYTWTFVIRQHSQLDLN